jgi:hypothetical protein
LHTRHTDVGENSVDSLDPFASQNRRKAGKVAVVQRKREADIRQSGTGVRQIVRIQVQSDEPALRPDTAEQFDRMPGPADCAIDHGIARTDVQGRQNGGQ